MSKIKIKNENFKLANKAKKEKIKQDVLELSSHNDELRYKYNDVIEIKEDIIKEQKINAIDISQITKYISQKYSKAQNDELFEGLLEAIEGGNNNLVQHVLEQTLTIKTDWVDAIQDCIFAMERIINKPKLSLREEQELVKIERAKRVDASAVRHLSTHTQYIKIIRDDGSVVPSKIVTRNLEEEMAIYENRFLYALLMRMKTFVNKRYNIIMEYAKVKDNTTLSYVSNFKYGSAEIDCRLNVGVKVDKEADNAQEANAQTLKKLQFIKDQIDVMEASQFMRVMKKAKPVYPPIQKTNILKSNPEYSVCYKLWLMLSAYNTVGYSVNIIEKNLPFDQDYFDDVTKIVATSTQVMLVNNKIREAIYAQVKPTKILKKEYKVKKGTSLSTNVLSENKRAKTSDVHEFYYERMKAMILHLNDLADALSVTSELEIPKATLFKTVYNQIQKINKDMFDDILKLESLEQVKDQTDDIEAKYIMQKKLCERYKQIKQYKEQEIKKAIAEEKVQEKKLEALSGKLAKFKQQEKERIRKEKLLEAKQKAEEKRKEKELERKKMLQEKAKEREKALKAKEEERKRKLLAKQKEKERLEKERIRQKELERIRQEKLKLQQEIARKKMEEQARAEQERIRQEEEKAKALALEEKQKRAKKRQWYVDFKEKERAKNRALRQMVIEGIKESKTKLLSKNAKVKEDKVNLSKIEDSNNQTDK